MKNRMPANVPASRILTTAVLSCFAGLSATFLCTLLLSILIENGSLRESAANLSFLCALPGAFIAGMATASRAGKRMLPYGILGGMVFFLLLLLIGAVFLPDQAFGGRIPATLAVCLGASALGAVLAPRR